MAAAFPSETTITVKVRLVGEDGEPLKATDAFVQQLADRVIEVILQRRQRGSRIL